MKRKPKSKPVVPKHGWAFGVPPPIATTPIEQDIGGLISLIEEHPESRELFIQCAASSHRTSCEYIEAHLQAWCQPAPRRIQ
jgi:hypothetical protein